jgi:uncharacterized RDD family membrane protein YckC
MLPPSDPLDSFQERATDYSAEIHVVNKGIRFFHFVIDLIVFYVLVLILGFGIGTLDIGPAGIPFLIIPFCYWIFMEAVTGQTIGKMLTGSVVVRKDGSAPPLITIIGRNLARFIPLEPLSFLLMERGWHDSLSNTYVVSKKSLRNISNPR